MVEVRRVTLLLVDDHNIVRLGLKALLRTVPHLVVVGEAGTVAGGVAEAQRLRPDIVVMDVRLPDGTGVEACREIRSLLPFTRVLMLTSFADEEAVISSIVAGASGYLLKETEPEQLIEALDTVAGGGSLLDGAVVKTVVDWMRRIGSSEPKLPDALTEQEQRILQLIAEGKTNKEIAAALFFSEHTVKAYVSRILHKLHLARRSEAAAFIAGRTARAATEPYGGSA